MPILVKDFTWEESEETVRITVPLKGVKPNKVDIFSTEEYIKVSYPPYLFEVFLFAPVEDVKNKATVSSGTVVFSLIKKEAGLWNALQPVEIEDKEFTRRKREEAIERAHERAKEEEQLRETQKREQERYALREQMRMEEEERRRIKEIKEQERHQASEAIEELKKESDNRKESTSGLDSDDDDDNDDDDDGYAGDDGEYDTHDDDNKDMKFTVNQNKTIINGNKDEEKAASSPQKALPKSKTKGKAQARTRHQSKKKFDLLDKPLPAPREAGCIQVSFTPRPFKTAARESKAPEEEEWLKKVAEASRNKKTLKDDPDAVDMEEMNPLWLKDKGINFYKSGNFVAAINAFTAALVLDSNIPSLFSNRAACHLHMKQYKESIQDCSSALELLTPPVPDNASSRCKALVRRGTALYQLSAYVEALQDYEDALKLDPNNESLKLDAERIRNIIQGTS